MRREPWQEQIAPYDAGRNHGLDRRKLGREHPMRRPLRTCPQCGASLKYKELLRTAVVFPCPACGVRLGFTKWFVTSTFFGTIATPPLIFWALGFSWPQIIIAELLLGYPILWLVLKYGMYVLRAKIVVYVPPMSFAQLWPACAVAQNCACATGRLLHRSSLE